MNSDDDNSPPIDRRRSGRGRKSKSLQLSMVLAEELAEQLAGEFDDSPGEDAPPPQLLSTVSECDDPPKEVPATRSLVSSSYQGHSIHNISSTYLANDDEDLLSRTISDVGLHAFGAIFVELWVVSSDGRHMKRPSGGHWMNPSFAQSVRPPSRALDVNNHAPDCAPGESLAGTLFKESFRLGRTTGKRKVHWRQIKSLIDDPFIQQGPGRRMEQIHDLGIGLVATVPFTFQGRHGIVLYMSRSTANLERLRAEENENYLVGATDLIGASFAIRIPRARCARVRKEVFRSAVEKVKKEIRSKKGQKFFSVSVQEENDESRLPNDDNDDDAGDNEGNYSSIRDIPETWRRTATTFEAYSQLASYHLQNYTKYITRLLQNSVRKYRGAGLHGPPRQSLAEAVAVFTGVFVVMLSLVSAQGRLQEYSEAWSSNGDKEAWSFDASWYTSSLCIIFALSAAPVGQPRQIVLAHIWCICVGVVFQQIPTGEVTNWLEFSQIPKDERIPGLVSSMTVL